MKVLVRTLAICLLFATQAFPQAGPSESDRSLATIDFETARLSRNVTAVRITAEITLDGLLDEPVWELGVPCLDRAKFGLS